MVVITLSTALIFALVVFPAMVGAAGLASHDTGSLRALFSGRFRDFVGGGKRDGAPALASTAGALSVGRHDVRQSGLWGAEVAAMHTQSDQGGLMECESLARITLDDSHLAPD